MGWDELIDSIPTEDSKKKTLSTWDDIIDSVPNENEMSSIPEASWLDVAQGIPVKAAAGINNMVGGGIDWLEDTANLDTGIGDAIRNNGRNVLDFYNTNENIGENLEKRLFSDIGTSTLQMVPTLLAPNPFTAAATLGVGGGFDKYSDLRDNGASYGSATGGAGLQAAYDTASEMIPMGRFLNKIPAARGVKEKGTNIIKGGIEEFIQEFGSGLLSSEIDNAIVDKERSSFGDLVYQGTTGFGAGVTMGTVSSLTKPSTYELAKRSEADAVAQADERIKQGKYENIIDLASLDEGLVKLQEEHSKVKNKYDAFLKGKKTDIKTEMDVENVKADLFNLEKEITRQTKIKNDSVDSLRDKPKDIPVEAPVEQVTKEAEIVKPKETVDIKKTEFPDVTGIKYGPQGLILAANIEAENQKKQQQIQSKTEFKNPDLANSSFDEGKAKREQASKVKKLTDINNKKILGAKAYDIIVKAQEQEAIRKAAIAPALEIVSEESGVRDTLSIPTENAHPFFETKMETGQAEVTPIYADDSSMYANEKIYSYDNAREVLSPANYKAELLTRLIPNREDTKRTMFEEKKLGRDEKRPRGHQFTTEQADMLERAGITIVQKPSALLIAQGMPAINNVRRPNNKSNLIEFKKGKDKVNFMPGNLFTKEFLKTFGKARLSPIDFANLYNATDIPIKVNGQSLRGDVSDPREYVSDYEDIPEEFETKITEAINKIPEEIPAEFLNEGRFDSVENLNDLTNSRSFKVPRNFQSEVGANQIIPDVATFITDSVNKLIDSFDSEGKFAKKRTGNLDVNQNPKSKSDAYFTGDIKIGDMSTVIPALSPTASLFVKKMSLVRSIALRFPEFNPTYQAGLNTVIKLPSMNIYDAENDLRPFSQLTPEEQKLVAHELGTARIMEAKGFKNIETPEALASRGFSEKQIAGLQAVRTYMQGTALDQTQGALLADPPIKFFDKTTGEVKDQAGLDAYNQKIKDWVSVMRKMKYVPFSRFGQLYVYTERNGNGEKHFSFHANRTSQMAAITKLKGEGVPADQISEGHVQPAGPSTRTKGFDGMPLEFLAFLADTGDVEAAEALKEAMPKIRSLPNNSIQENQGFFNSLMKAQLTDGYSEDFGRSIANYATRLATYNARKVGKSLFRNAITGLPDGGYLKQRAVEHMNYTLDGQDAAPALRGLFAVWYLSRPLSAIVNVTQQLTFTLPLLQKYSKPGEATKNWMAGQKDMYLFYKQDGKKLAEKNPEMFAFLKDLSRQGALSDFNTREFSQASRGVKGTAKGYFENISSAMLMAFTGVEMMNRTQAAASFFRAAKSMNPNITPSEMITQASDFIIETQGDYSKAGKPEAFRGKLAPFTIFRSYMVLFYSTLAREIGAKNFKVVSAMAAAQGLLGGALIVPGVAMVLRVLKMMGESPEEDLKKFTAEFSTKRGWDRDVLGDALFYGLPGLIDSPLTLASSLDMGGILPEGNAKAASLDIITQGLTGVVASPFQNFDRAQKYWGNGDRGMAVETMSPANLKAVLKTARSFREDGLNDRDAHNILPGIGIGERATILLGGQTKRQSNENMRRQFQYDNLLQALDKEHIEAKLARLIDPVTKVKSPEFFALVKRANEEGIVINWRSMNEKFLMRTQKGRQVMELKKTPVVARAKKLEIDSWFDFKKPAGSPY